MKREFYKSQEWKNLAREVRKKYNNRCARCGKRVYGSDSHVHHKIPLSEGGQSAFINLELLCSRCHSREHGHPMSIRPKDQNDIYSASE